MPEKPTKLGNRPAANVGIAANHEQPVILYCLSCGHSRQMHAWALAGLLGSTSFGLIIGNLRCKGCGENVGVVLPLQAPTPRQWARLNRLNAPKFPEKPSEDPDRDLLYRLETWTERGSIDRTLATLGNVFIGTAAFDEAVAQYPTARITLRAKAQVIKNSDRVEDRPER